ncbi:Uncharacterized protein FWK35_00012203 [Aphis craccivora]|uniref:Uncharacterized protein n=1 Tax=Aphis craccivora TaxID=307492 RepID=A0A6G0ZC10_APHCR|nr:Uncharacterized protein FWK35_00012203 [Aphis craccivora]
MLQFQTLGVVSDGKVNILGTLWRSKVNIFQQFSKNSKKNDGKTGIFTTKPLVLWGVKSKKFSVVFKSVRKNPKKVTEKWEFLHKTSFRPNRFFYVVVIQKIITLNFQKMLTFFDIDKKIFNAQKFKFLRNLSKTRKFARNSIGVFFTVEKFFLAQSNSNIDKNLSKPSIFTNYFVVAKKLEFWYIQAIKT